MGWLSWLDSPEQEREKKKRDNERLYCGGCGGTSRGGYCPGPHPGSKTFWQKFWTE